MSDDKLTMRISYRPGMTSLEKALIALETSDAFHGLVNAIVEDMGATGSIEYKMGAQVFDGEDVDAQPIFNALWDLREKERASARTALAAATRERDEALAVLGECRHYAENNCGLGPDVTPILSRIDALTAKGTR